MRCFIATRIHPSYPWVSWATYQLLHTTRVLLPWQCSSPGRISVACPHLCWWPTTPMRRWDRDYSCRANEWLAVGRSGNGPDELLPGLEHTWGRRIPVALMTSKLLSQPGWGGVWIHAAPGALHGVLRIKWFVGFMPISTCNIVQMQQCIQMFSSVEIDLYIDMKLSGLA